MAAKAKTKLVTERDGVYDFRCPWPVGCGEDTADGHTPWSSTGWNDREHAVARGKQHLREHETASDPDVETEVMPTLEEFRIEHGLAPEDAGQAVNPDNWEF